MARESANPDVPPAGPPALAHLPIFHGVSPELLRRLEPLRRTLQPEEILFNEGDPGGSMFVVLSGQVLIIRRDVPIIVRRPPELIGEQAFVDLSPRSATARAVGPTELLELPQSVGTMLLSDPQFSRNLLSILSVKLRETSEERVLRYEQEQELLGQFRAHVAPEVIDELLAQGAQHYGRARYTDAVILFADIRAYTERSATMSPKKIAYDLGAYFDMIVDIIHAHGGMVDKFIGDAVMAVWGYRPTGKSMERQALNCAVALVLGAGRITFGGRPIAIGVGINAGRVFMGIIGGAAKRQFTVIGTPVNVASRLERATRTLGAPIVIGEEVYRRLPPELQARHTAHPNTPIKGLETMTCYSFNPLVSDEEV